MWQLLRFIITKKNDPIKNLNVFKPVKSALIAFCFLTFMAPFHCLAQIDDVGLWLGVNIQSNITRQLEGSLTEQLRLSNDATRINLILSDLGLDYSFSKKLKVGLHYRFINRNKENYYSKRHRFYADIAWKEKVKFISFTLRERIQEQFSDYNSSETGKIPEWVLRSKLTAKIDLDKKYIPYLSFEVFYLIDNAKEENGITDFRYETGINYEFNRINSVNPFLLCQITRSTNFIELIYGVSYTYTF